MNTIKNGKLTEIIIKKSKFISIAINVNNTIECEKILLEYRKNYSDCTHLCYAYVINGIEKCSDDGEPSGTAGKPILNIIKSQKLNCVLLIVIRYFGGVKLGAGGLVRAYTESGVEALKNSEVTVLHEVINISFHINFDKAFNIYVLTNLGIFKIVERVGNDFIIECEKSDLDLVLNEIKKFNVSKIEIKEVLR